MTTTNTTLDRTEVRFAPRRIGHGNFFVSDLVRSMEYYEHVFGLQVVFRESEIGAGFLSNGNSHHDVGLIEIPKTTLVGRDGQVQVPVDDARKAGLNHIGFEMESEAQLVAAYERAKAAGVEVHRTVDHTIARSVYMFDPDGYYLEFYADSQDDWRAVMEGKDEQELLTGSWTPDLGTASPDSKYVVDPKFETVDGAPLQPRRAARIALLVEDLAASVDFYTNVIGLTVVASSDGDDGFAVLAGTVGAWDLGLFQAAAGESVPQMHHFGFELSDTVELDGVVARLQDAGATVEHRIDHPTKTSVSVKDPDGILFEFFVERSYDPQDLSATVSPLPYLI